MPTLDQLVVPSPVMPTMKPIRVPAWAKEVQSKLEGLTRQLKDQAHSDTIELVLSLRIPADVENDDLLEKAIIPRWKEFVEAVNCESNSQWWWSFEELQLPMSMLNMLQPALVTRDIHTLKFKDHVSEDGSELFDFMCEIVQKNHSIKRLVLKSGFKIFHSRDLAYAVRHHPSLEELHFGNAKISPRKGSVLDSIIYGCQSKTLKYLNIHKCCIGNEGSAKISTLLKYDFGLSRLDLVDVRITDSDAAILAEGLRSNTNLRFLSLTGRRNSMTSEGRKSLLGALFNTSSLNSIGYSNHTCIVQTVAKWTYKSEPCQYEALLDTLNRNSCPKDNLKWKILSILYATKGRGIREEFKRYCHNKVLPEMLALICEDFSDDEMEESTEVISCTESPAEENEVDDSDAFSIESNRSFDGYDSELDELDDAFEDVDEVYEDLDKSFTDLAFTGKRARLTVLFQILRLWALSLLERNPSIDPSGNQALPEKNERTSRPKRKRRELESLKLWHI